MERSVSGVGVLDKAVVVLDALEVGPLSLGELVKATGLPRATAHRLAVALEDHALVRRDPDGRFTLGLRLVALGRAAADAFPLGVAARPALEALRDRTGESVQLYVAEGEGRRCVVSLQSPHALRWIVPEGALLPMERGSAGKVLRTQGNTVLRTQGNTVLRTQGNTVLRTQGNTVLRAGASGWAESVEEREPGVCSVSAPVVDGRGRVLAAVSVSGPVERLTRTPGERFGAAVVAAAAEVAAALR